MSDLIAIVLFEHDPKPSFEVWQMLHGDGFAHQSRHAVSPLVVQAFDDAGLSAAFFAGTVLPGGEPLGISLIEVGVHQLAAVRSGNLKPQLLQRLLAPSPTFHART